MPETVTVTIPGYGDVDFPSSMTPDQISQASAKLYRTKQLSDTQQQAWVNRSKSPVGLPPGLAGPPPSPSSFTQSLPAMGGGMAGAVTGAGYGAALGGPFGAALGGLAGAGLGALGGEGLRQATAATLGGQGTAAIDPQRAAQEANLNMAGEATGQILGKATSAIGDTFAPSLVQKLRNIRSTSAQQIEQKLAPSGKEAKQLAMKIAPSLAEDPYLLAAKQAKFDQLLFGRYRAAKAGLDAAEESIVPGTMVAKRPILDGIDKAIDSLQVPATAGESITGHPDALKVLIDQRNTLSKLPDQIPFEDLLKYRQQLDKAIASSGGWKETASAADRAAMLARKETAGIIRDQLAETSTELKSANQGFNSASKAMDAAGLDTDTGRRLANVGKPPVPGMLERTLPWLARGAATAAGGAALYRLIEEARRQ